MNKKAKRRPNWKPPVKKVLTYEETLKKKDPDKYRQYMWEMYKVSV